jgi:hypothetical protein
MSTYFSHSYRIRRRDAIKVFEFFQSLKRALEHKYYNQTIEEVCEYFEEQARKGIALNFERYKKEIHSRERNSRLYRANPESGLRYYFDKRYLYLKFWGDDYVLEDALQAFEKEFKPESFNWWNSTDKPDSISEKRWKARRKKWDEILNGRWNFGHLPHIELVPDYIEKEDIPTYLYWADTTNEDFIEKFRARRREEKNKY